MTETYRFFTGATGDPRAYDQADLRDTFKSLASNGVVRHETDVLLVSATSPETMAVSLGPGRAWIEGYSYENTAALTLSIGAADPSNARIDRVVVRLDEIVNRDIHAVIREGTPAAQPSAPALVRESGIYEISLAQVVVPPGAVTISQAYITREVAIPATCGWAGPVGGATSILTVDADLDGQTFFRMKNMPTPVNAGDAATKAYVDQTAFPNPGVPTGTIVAWGGNAGNVPSGWLLCDGSYVSTVTYSALYNVIGTQFGALQGSDFKLPDARAKVLGGYDSRYPSVWSPIGTIGGAQAHATTSSGSQNLVEWLVVAGAIIKT